MTPERRFSRLRPHGVRGPEEIERGLRRIHAVGREALTAGQEALSPLRRTYESSGIPPALRQVESSLGSLLRPPLSRVAPIVARAAIAPLQLGAALLGYIASAIEWLQRVYRDRLVPALSGTVTLSSQRLTPRLVAAACAVASSGLLIGSQFLEYRGIAVGAPLYKGEIAVDAPAPITATATAGDAHYWVIIPIAVLAALAAVLALNRGNRMLAISVSALGAAAIAVTLAVDLPRGLDPVNALPYSDAAPRLLGGFWAELFAGLALLVSGVMLTRGDAPSRALRRVRQPSPNADFAAEGGR